METAKENTSVENLDFLCSAEWHFAKLGKYEALVYGHAMRLTMARDKNGKQIPRNYHPAISKIAAYFGTSQRTILRAIQNLEKRGFFIRMRTAPGKSVSYRPVEHKEWAGRFPGQCLVLLAMPWTEEEKDPLVIRLHAASDGRLKLFKNFVIGMRRTGHSDDAILEHWENFYSNHGDKWKGIYGRFMAYLREQPITKNEEETIN